METKTEKKADWFIITLHGKFVIKNLSYIRNSFDIAANSNELQIAIDLSSVSHVDSSAITILVNFHKKLLAKGGKSIIFGANKDITEIFSIIGIDKIMPVYTSDEFHQKLNLNENKKPA
jgi:anti-anti-sigma factor